MHTVSTSSYKRHRFPSEGIRYAVWVYFRCSLSYRDVEDRFAERGIVVTYETICQWGRTCGQQYANTLRRRRPQTGDTWHLDEVFLKMNGKQPYLWRAVDQHGIVRDMFVQSRRNKTAAKQCFRKRLQRGQYVPRVIITDTLARYGAAKRAVLPQVEHRQQKRRNHRAENAHQSTRVRERVMRRFKSAGHAQRLLAAYGRIREHVCLGRHRCSAEPYRLLRHERLIQYPMEHANGCLGDRLRCSPRTQDVVFCVKYGTARLLAVLRKLT